MARTRPRWDLNDDISHVICCSLRTLALSFRKDKSKGNHLPTVTVDQLPLEVWARVFEHLRPDSKNAVAGEQGQQARAQEVAKLMADQACFHQLKLVCCKFRDVFSEHPELSNEITISKPSDTFVPSILLWIQRWRSSICNFQAFSGVQHHELVLGALACCSSSLGSVFLTNAPAAAVSALPAFNSLKRCDFDDQNQLSLSALQALPSLEELYLSAGDYSSVPSAGQLTMLWVQEANVEFSRASMEDISLKYLVLYSCELTGLHDSGLTACKALTDLEIADAAFTAGFESDILQVGINLVASVPAKISELTCLTTLDIVVPCSLADPFDLDWLYSVVSLKRLQLKVGSPFKVSEQLTQLKELTSLTLIADDDTGQASYSVQWEAMQALKHLELAGQIAFDFRMLQLTSIKSLERVKLTNLHPCAKDGTASHLARLMYQLAAQCPQVEVHVDGTLIGLSAL